MKISQNDLAFYFKKFIGLEDDIKELTKAYTELENLPGVLRAREVVLEELNKRRQELAKLSNTNVQEVTNEYFK